MGVQEDTVEEKPAEATEELEPSAEPLPGSTTWAVLPTEPESEPELEAEPQPEPEPEEPVPAGCSSSEEEDHELDLGPDRSEHGEPAYALWPHAASSAEQPSTVFFRRGLVTPKWRTQDRMAWALGG